MIRLVAAAALAAAGVPAIAAEQGFPVGGFDRIALGGSQEVTVTTGRAVSVRASGDPRALDRLDIRVESGTLKIGSKRGDWGWNNWGNAGKVHIDVTVPMVRGVEVGGSGTVSIDRVKVPRFDAQLGGSGNIRVVALDTDRSDFNVAGSGSVEAAGRCGTSHASIAGSGRLKLSRLVCETLTVDVAGSGSVDANARRTADVSVMGSGDVRVAGGARCAVSKAGSGSVNCNG